MLLPAAILAGCDSGESGSTPASPANTTVIPCDLLTEAELSDTLGHRLTKGGTIADNIRHSDGCYWEPNPAGGTGVSLSYTDAASVERSESCAEWRSIQGDNAAVSGIGLEAVWVFRPNDRPPLSALIVCTAKGQLRIAFAGAGKDSDLRPAAEALGRLAAGRL